MRVLVLAEDDDEYSDAANLAEVLKVMAPSLAADAEVYENQVTMRHGASSKSWRTIEVEVIEAGWIKAFER